MPTPPSPKKPHARRCTKQGPLATSPTILHFLLITLLFLSCTPIGAQKNDPHWVKPELKGHWKLVDTEIVDDVPFLHLHAPETDPMRIAREDSPWDHYRPHDLVFEQDSMYMLDYPIQAFELARYHLDTGYLQVATRDNHTAYPAELVHDTLLLYKPVATEPGYFKEAYTRTTFNDSILGVMKRYGINYPELAGTWMLVREEDYDYGTHYELKFPYAIPDSIVFTRTQMIAALEHPKVYMMRTNGVKRDYTFWYEESRIRLKPGKWFKGEEDPWIHFYKP